MSCSRAESAAGICRVATATCCFAGSGRNSIRSVTTSPCCRVTDPRRQSAPSDERIPSCDSVINPSHPGAHREECEDDDVLDEMNEKRPDAAPRLDHAARPDPAGESRHQNAQWPGRLSVVMTEPEENRRQQDRFGRAKDATEMREK